MCGDGLLHQNSYPCTLTRGMAGRVAGRWEKSPCPPFSLQESVLFPFQFALESEVHHLPKFPTWLHPQKFFLVSNHNSLGGHQRLSRKRARERLKSICPTESVWEGDREEEVSRGQGRETIVSGRRFLLIGHATLGTRESAAGMGRAVRNKG